MHVGQCFVLFCFVLYNKMMAGSGARSENAMYGFSHVDDGGHAFSLIIMIAHTLLSTRDQRHESMYVFLGSSQ